ncbi:hypothetical protein K0M31_012648 [Melipona bicolor]|uniref:Uncharacterized protein n=1 Tax=Melipona bicolor TaxID=60889 RepID=A0AA40KHA0_9HYME|nr:hypothetical protein K0M31_012648 [Melipona bicolor]
MSKKVFGRIGTIVLQGRITHAGYFENYSKINLFWKMCSLRMGVVFQAKLCTIGKTLDCGVTEILTLQYRTLTKDTFQLMSVLEL